MKTKNILLVAIIITISVGGVLIYNLIPKFDTTEFNQNSIVQISEGSTTTLNTDENPTTTIQEIEDEEMIDIQPSEIEILLENNSTINISEQFVTYLLVGSDRRSENSSLSRGFVQGQRADVIILALINKKNNSVSLVSIPRDLLIKNSCTQEIQRINSTFQQNDCGNSAENLSANILNITGLLVDHFALFTFEGFEKIIDSLDGVEICLEQAQREGYSFELNSGCQIVNGSIALNWVVSRNTEIMVGDKIVDESGNDASSWEPMSGVSDLYRVKKQQQIVISLLNRLNEFNSYTDLYNLIKALELTFTIDENLTIPNATQILWGYRNFNFSEVNKLTVPTKPYRTQDGKEVLVLTQNFYNFVKSRNLLD
jgi:LCP family protein required for cell wall assembly